MTRPSISSGIINHPSLPSCAKPSSTTNEKKKLQKQKQKGIFEMIQSRRHIDKVPQISIVHLTAVR
ncbi:hypothetical protein NC653_017544 [Populus alba x Populus x berolinensis]|uniref:Uncharacterized protein n=1 Tax=Populus alba x Populus x berolinensis TaxID=444605 RepID=A0AAD6W147_9ROSI|nr:hypothetical protein NC653_017544 [Populus alba x Populus x berolinensis]